MHFFARAVVTLFDKLSPTLATTPADDPVLEQLSTEVVWAVDEVDVESSDFLQPIIRINGKDKTKIILNDFIFPPLLLLVYLE